MNIDKEAIKLHKKNKGKIAIKAKIPLNSSSDLSLAYTPGVGAVCNKISKDKNQSFVLSNRGNQVAIVTDGSAVLGLGNIGPEAAMPVMEGKAAIFKKFAGIDAFPLAIKTQDSEEIIKFVKNIEPSFAGINLEDIAAPRCFEILERLENELSIPVFHDDQDGTAIVTLAALINACRVLGKSLAKIKVVVNGAGAAGISISRLLLASGVKELILVDSQGIIYEGRRELNRYKKEIATKTNKNRLKGWKEEALVDADVFIGVSKSKQLDKHMIAKMKKNPIIFPMANPIPEICPKDAFAAGAAIVGTGRSDFPNQINNALIFPGIFQGLLKTGIKKITQAMKIDIAISLAMSLKKPNRNKIIPKITDKFVVERVAAPFKGKRR